MKILFKNGDKFFGGDGKEATEQEVETFLLSLETEPTAAVDAITEGLALGVAEELENAKEDLETLITATGETDFSSAIDAITGNKSKIIVQAEAIGILEQYISDIQTMTSTGTITDAKVAVATAIADAAKAPEQEVYWAGEILSLKEALQKAQADTKVLEEFITELQETAKVANPEDIKAVLEAKVTETAKAKKA